MENNKAICSSDFFENVLNLFDFFEKYFFYVLICFWSIFELLYFFLKTFSFRKEKIKEKIKEKSKRKNKRKIKRKNKRKIKEKIK